MLGNGQKQPRMYVRLLFSRRETRQSDLFEPLLDGVGLVESPSVSLVDGRRGRLGSCLSRGQRRARASRKYREGTNLWARDCWPLHHPLAWAAWLKEWVWSPVAGRTEAEAIEPCIVLADPAIFCAWLQHSTEYGETSSCPTSMSPHSATRQPDRPYHYPVPVLWYFQILPNGYQVL